MNKSTAGGRAAAFPPPGHDHGPCLATTLARAQAAFDTLGLRLTPLRRRVLEEIAGSHSAIGAYDILDRLSQQGSRRLAPISVYRALDSLVETGMVHRLESRNAFFACHAAHAGDRRQVVLACETCGAVAEIDMGRAFGEIGDAALASGFKPERILIEVMGTCAACNTAAR